MIYLFNLTVLFWIRVLLKVRSIINRLIPKLSSRSIIERNFKENLLFSFIQVGANDGVSFDFLYDVVIKRKSKGIVIEPVKEYYNELVENYRIYQNIKTVNIAVHPTKKLISMHKIKESSYPKYPDWVKGIASLNPNHYNALNIESIDVEEILVDGTHLMNIISEQYEGVELDYFQVDTEGFDYEVIKMIDFNLINPKMIKFESVSLSNEDYKSVKLLLEEKGYYVFKEFNDTIAVNLKKIQLI